MHMPDLPQFTEHAEMRIAQRNFTIEDVYYILKHGRAAYRAGVIFCQLREKDLPREDRSDERKHKLVGCEVVLTPCKQLVMTVYHARDLKNSRRKSKHNYRKGGYHPRC